MLVNTSVELDMQQAGDHLGFTGRVTSSYDPVSLGADSREAADTGF